MRTDLIIGLLVLVAGVFLVAGFIMGHNDATPDCPTEDSCSVDYRHGEWHIERVTP